VRTMEYGYVELELKELTNEQLIKQVLKLQSTLAARSDAELRKMLNALEDECYTQGYVLDKICGYIQYRGYETPETKSIHKVVLKALIDREQQIAELSRQKG